jgi:hypothetical protein
MNRAASSIAISVLFASLAAASIQFDPGEIDPGCGQPPMGSEGFARLVVFADDQAGSRWDGEALLDRLEVAGRDMRSLEADLTLIRFDALLEESETRLGQVLLTRDGEATRVAIVFDEFIDGSGHGEQWRQHWVYADGWLDELDHRQKRYVRRQLVMPDEPIDPLKLGEGPIPLPIAQRKADVLARFEVIEPPPPSPPLLDRLEDFVGLRLVPRAGTEMAKETAYIELFYDRQTLAPRGIRVLELNGDRDTVLLRRPKVNGAMGEPQKSLLLLESPDPAEWAWDVRPLRIAPGQEAPKPADSTETSAP